MKNANGQFSGSEGRRSSFSDKSEEGSPTRTRAQNQAKLAPVDEVSRRALLMLPMPLFSLYSSADAIQKTLMWS